MLKKLILSTALGASLCALTLPVVAKPTTPATGSATRAAIMNAVRPRLGGGHHKPIITADHFKLEAGWTYLTGGFDYADGAKLEEQFREGSGTNFSVLLHLEKSKWKVKKFIYNGDVVEPEFMRAFPKAPKAIFQRDPN